MIIKSYIYIYNKTNKYLNNIIKNLNEKKSNKNNNNKKVYLYINIINYIVIITIM